MDSIPLRDRKARLLPSPACGSSDGMPQPDEYMPSVAYTSMRQSEVAWIRLRTTHPP